MSKHVIFNYYIEQALPSTKMEKRDDGAREVHSIRSQSVMEGRSINKEKHCCSNLSQGMSVLAQFELHM